MSVDSDRKAAATDWLERAAVDRDDARLIFQNRREHLENVAFHCQQSVEKLIKAFLVVYGISFPKVHDLARLLDEYVSQVDADLAAQANFARNLNVYAVATRYPEFGERIDGETAELLIDLTERAWALFEPRITALCVPEDGAEPLAPESDDDPAPRGGAP